MTGIHWLLLIAATAQTPTPSVFPFFEPIQPTRSVQVMAHRGAMLRAPENTRPALEASVADTVEWVEVDVRLTKDGHHILFHDESLDDKTNLDGRVIDHTLAELQKADAGAKFARRFTGERLITLDECLQLARRRVNLYLDCKQVDPALLAREVLAAEMNDQVVVYGNPQLLQAVRAVAGEKVPLMTKWRPKFGLDPWIDEVRPHVVEIDAEDVALDVCREFHRRGIKVQAKVLGDNDIPEVWDRMARYGVDWLQTDLAEEIIARRLLQAVGPNRVKISYHCGGLRYAPVNTIEALKKAVAMGADFVEFDLQTTRDGVCVVLHDDTLERTTSGEGAVRDHTLAEIRELNAGAWFGPSFASARVPTLDAFLAAAAPTGIRLYVDAKDVEPESLVQALERHGLTDRAVVYQSTTYLEKLKTIAPQLRRMVAVGDPSKLEELVERVQPFAIDLDWTIISRPLIDRCHARGIEVFSDALGKHETIAEYQKAIAAGIDVIQTDHPLQVLRAIELKLDITTRP